MNFNSIDKLTEKITGALSLIGLGLVFLLNTTGVVPWSVWGYFISIIVRIWPIFLIMAGLNIIFNSSVIAKAILNVLWFIFFAGLWIFIFISYPESKLYNSSINNIINFSENRIESSYELKVEDIESDLNEVNYEYNIVAGELNITDTNEDQSYFTADSKFYSNHGEPQITSSESNKVLDINFSQKFNNFFWWLGREALEYTSVIFNNNLDSNLDINLTAGRANIDLDEIKLKTSNINMTAGSVYFNVNEDSTFETLNLSITAGDFNLNIDKEYKVIITSDSTAGSVKVNGKDIRDGKIEFNTDKEDTLRINIDQTAGSVNINL